MSPTSITFLWHMHQPYYRNMITGECVQPWVRLHGIHSYYDMLRLYEDFPNSGANINFVPSLLRQIREYVEEGKTDKFFELSQIDAKELDPQQKQFILRNFFMANHERMIKPHPRYWKLFQQRGANTSAIDFEQAIRYFSWKDFLDMQVYYNLVWFGFKAREDFPDIEKMLQLPSSGHLFTEEDKKLVLNTQLVVLKKLFEKIKNAPKNVELTTTPFFHPIMPLVIDTDIAKRCMGKAPLPTRFAAPKHAVFQLNHGFTYFEQTMGYRPKGMWPAEGSVCPEMIPMLEDAGINWIATDEGILNHSGIGGKRHENIYKPYIAEHDGRRVTMIFRDRELSDLISFSYSKMDAEASVSDFIGKVKEIAKHTHNPLITVLLDGENPWESYEENGKKFLTGLLAGLDKEGIKAVCANQYLSENPPKDKIKNLHSGSWINSNFGIWIGKPQKNQGWGYLKRTADELGIKLSGALDNPARPANELLALESFGAACGSDWFWWFDDDFESEFKSDFDKIFRMHLKNTFSLLGRDIPMFLYQPIFKYSDPDQFAHGLLKPQAFMYPIIDGLNTSYFEWINSVKIDIGKNRGPMAQSDELFETIFFGFNEDAFFLRFDPLKKDITFTLADTEEIVIYLHNHTSKYKIRVFFDGKRYKFQFVESPEEGYSNGNHNVKLAVRSACEIGFNINELGYKVGEEITIILTVIRGGIEVRHYSHLTFNVPDKTYEKEMWSV